MTKSFELLIMIGLGLGHLVIHQSAHAGERCTELFASKTKPSSVGTDGLIAYLNSLLERQMIGDPELLRLIDGLLEGVLVNPIHEEQTWVSSAALIHREEIQKYFLETQLDREKLLDWSKSSLKEKQRVRVRREETKEETQGLHLRAEFHRIPAGKFQMKKGKSLVEVNLSHPFEAMSTDVTQAMWVEEMGENPSHFQKGESAIVVNKHGRSVEMKPDHPVEQITWWSAVEYANRKSTKMNLKPAYDLSDIQWAMGTSAEAGTLAPASDEEVRKLRINAPDGNIYQAEGFRLPTEAEWEYLLTDLGRTKGTYPHDIDKSVLADYVWYFANSGRETKPVAATAKSFQINGRNYYDLTGNVSKWMHDSFDGGLSRIISGGSWASTTPELSYFHRSYQNANTKSRSSGFRLVRTLE